MGVFRIRQDMADMISMGSCGTKTHVKINGNLFTKAINWISSVFSGSTSRTASVSLA